MLRLFLIGYGEPPVLLNQQDWRIYDLAVAPSEYMVDYFRKAGMKAELLRLGLESSVFLSLFQDSQRYYFTCLFRRVCRTSSF